MMIKSRKNCFLTCFAAITLFAVFFSVTALPTFGSIPTDSQELTFHADPVLKELKILLKQGDLVKFYQTAHTHMGQLEWRDIRGGVSPDKLDRLLLIARLASAAPLFKENESTPFEQMTQDFDSAGDIRLKGKVMVDLVIISKINLSSRAGRRKPWKEKRRPGKECLTPNGSLS